MRNTLLLIHLLIPMLLCGTPAENIRFSHITVNDGIAHNNVNSIVQDDRGFIWIGTRGGLCNYDGYRIRKFNFSETDSTTISHDYVYSVLCDNQQRIWIATEGGLCRYDRAQDNFQRYKFSVNPRFRSKALFQSQNGDIFTGVANTLYRYNPSKDSFEAIPIAGWHAPREWTQIEEGNDGTLYLASIKGIACTTLNGEKLIQKFPDDAPPALKNTHITCLAKDSLGRIYIGSHYSGLYIFDPTSRTIDHIAKKDGLSSDIIRRLLITSKGTLWIGGEMGVDILDLKTRQIEHIRHDQADITGINDNAIYALHEDDNHNIWVGTFFGGVNIYLHDYRNFAYYPFGASNKHLSGKAVREIRSAGKDHLWIATEDGGLNYFNTRTRTFEHNQANGRAIPISYHNVHSVTTDGQGDLWIGMFTGGINRYRPSDGRMTYYTNANTGFAINATMSLCYESINNEVLVGAVSGLRSFSIKENRFYEFTDPKVRDRHIYCIAQDANGLVWIGTRANGLFTYDPQSRDIYRIDLQDHNASFISSLLLNDQDNTWIGTNNEGLICYNQKNGQLQRFTTKEGLPSNSIMSIIRDNDNKLWVATSNGLCRMDTETGQTDTFTIEHGLPTNQFNYSSCYKSPEGELYFGSINGMISFFPSQLNDPNKNLRVCFTKLLIGGEEAKIGGNSPLKQHITETSSISLSYKQARLMSLNFTAFNFSQKKIFYAFRIGNSPWQSIGTQSQIFFSNLRTGNNVLSVKASEDGIVWDEKGARTLYIHVYPPFLLSWIAFLLYGIILGAGVYIAYKIAKMKLNYRDAIRLERLELQKQEELNRRKIDFFTNISHELKTPLTLIMSPISSMSADPKLDAMQRKTLHVVTNNAKRMLLIIDELISFSKIEMGQTRITIQSGVIFPFLDELCQIFKIIASENNLQFIIDIDPTDQTKVWFSPSVVEKIVYNLLSNAFKFTPSGGTIRVKASVLTHEQTQFLQIQIVDTGIGIPEESIDRIFDNYYQVNPSSDANGSGIGLAFAKRLATLHKGDIKMESVIGIGSIFKLEINVSKSAFQDSECSPVELDQESVSSYSYRAPAIDNFDNSIVEINRIERKKMRLLVVEDNKELNEYICGIFHDRYEVFSAFDGKQGYEMTCSLTPDLIISDVMMPRMDGFEMTHRIKSMFEICHIPIVILTAKTTTEETIEGYEQGADAYITKPFNAQSLELQVTNILNTRMHNIKRFKQSFDNEEAKITANPRDEKFLNEVIALVRENINNEYFSVNDLTQSLNISRSMLYMKLKNLADVSATELIRNIRLKESKAKLLEGLNVSEASFAVGISDPNYFTKCFKRQFGITPTEFIKTHIQSNTNISTDD